MAVLGGAFLIFVVLSSSFAGFFFPPFPSFLLMLSADGLGLGVAWYLYIQWEKRPILMLCPKCEGIISSQTPWVCKACGKENRKVAEFPFVHKCGNPDCGVEPKAYRCHHEIKNGEFCGEMIFLSEDRDKTNYAHCLNSPAEVPAPTERTIKRQTHEETKEDRVNEIEIAELELKLKKIDNEREGPKIKSPADLKKEACERDYVAIMGVHEYLRRKTDEVKELYKNDSQSLKDAMDAIEEIRKRHS